MSRATETRAETTRAAISGVVLVLVAVAVVSTAGVGVVAGDTTATDGAVVETQNNTSVGVVAEDADTVDEAIQVHIVVTVAGIPPVGINLWAASGL